MYEEQNPTEARGVPEAVQAVSNLIPDSNKTVTKAVSPNSIPSEKLVREC